MTTEDFNNCSRNDLLFAVKECIRQARGHYDVAGQAAKLGNYGIGNSLLILSVEEAVKGMILMTGFFGIKFPYDVEPFFANHKIRHDQAPQIQAFVNIVWRIRDSYLSIACERQLDWRAFVKLGVDLAVASISTPDTSQEAFSTWWSTANKLKNDGFCIGFYDGKWAVPSQVTKAIYDHSLGMARPFVECLGIINQLEPNEVVRTV
jgi:AbiV family abortive infection protein